MRNQAVQQSLRWFGAATLVGFAVPAIFSMGLRWERAVFLVPYAVIIGGFLMVYFLKHPLRKSAILRSWAFGLVAAAAASFFLLMNIRGQPASPAPDGAALAGALLWMGLVYGVMDGVFLNVMPVLAAHHAWPHRDDARRGSRIGRGVVALASSLLVTAAYHLGYAEFQGLIVLSVLLGNGVITLTYLLTRSPIAPVVTHVIMHVGAVLHGMETTLQLPPHYPS